MGWNMGVAFWYPQYPKAQMQLTPSAIRLRYKFYEKALSHSSTQDTKHLLPSWLNFEFVWSLLCSCNGYTCCNHILNPLNVLKVFGFLLPHIFIMLFLLCARSKSFCISLCNGEWTRTLQPAQEVVPWPPPWATPHSSTKEHLSPIFLSHRLSIACEAHQLLLILTLYTWRSPLSFHAAVVRKKFSTLSCPLMYAAICLYQKKAIHANLDMKKLKYFQAEAGGFCRTS